MYLFACVQTNATQILNGTSSFKSHQEAKFPDNGFLKVTIMIFKIEPLSFHF